MITLATEKLFGHGQEDDVSVVAWRSFKLPRKIAGSNNGETQLLRLLTNPSGWHGLLGQQCTVLRCDAGNWTKLSDRWAECHRRFSRYLRCLDEKRITAASRTVEEARGIKEHCAVSNKRVHWVKHLDDVGRQSDQTWISRSGCDGIVPGQETMEMYDINPLTDPVAFDTLLQDDSLSEDVREIMRMKNE